MKDKTAVMCHNIAKYNREHREPETPPLLEAVEILSEMQMNTPVDDEVIALEIATDYLRKIASGEIEEVVQAHWFKLSSDEWGCSSCGTVEYFDTLGGSTLSDYCPRCGAKMEDNHV